MSNFSITFTGDVLDEDPTIAIGVLQLREDREWFHATLGYWTVEDYEESWNKALVRLVNGASISCLVTSLTDPLNSNFLTTWPLYRSGDEVYVQNHLIFLDELLHEFDPATPWESSAPRSVGEDGHEISEWQLQVTDLREFLDNK
jgi:hypothetical protein